jgi:catechol 2,3-dioxygenase-like lactoylglutathione lyase family enzyme
VDLAGASPIALVATTDPARARVFYDETLGLRFVADEDFALVFDCGGIPLRVARVESFTPQPFTVLGWQVDDIVATVEVLSSRGVTFERYPGLEQDLLGVWTSPSGARVAWLKDPDGNTLSLTQFAR